MLSPASGTGVYLKTSEKVIRFAKKGCTNRPFYHIVVTERRRNLKMPVIEQLGTFDPIPNEHNEKLVSLNLERIRYWIGNGALTSKPVEQLLGLAGFYPIHPTSYIAAWRSRRAQAEQAQAEQEQAASAAASSAEKADKSNN